MNNKKVTVIRYERNPDDMAISSYCMDISNKNVVRSFLESISAINITEYFNCIPNEVVDDIMNQVPTVLPSEDETIWIIPEKIYIRFEDYEKNTIDNDFWEEQDRLNDIS